jgi:hypothetical protein
MKGLKKWQKLNKWQLASSNESLLDLRKKEKEKF